MIYIVGNQILIRFGQAKLERNLKGKFQKVGEPSKMAAETTSRLRIAHPKLKFLGFGFTDNDFVITFRPGFNRELAVKR